MDNRPIGVFDSGVGGLTAVRRLRELLPNEQIIFFGDTGRVPYGTRSNETIIKYTRQDVAFLRSFDVKAIVVACGTVSSVALEPVSRETETPMIGVVWPACAKALAATKNKRIGIIGTPATIRSGSYVRLLRAARNDLEIFTQACPLFVPLVENGRVHPGDPVIETMVREYLREIRDAGVDTLILGCTHYPLLAEVIGAFMGPDVTLIDTGAAAAESLRAMLVPGEGPGGVRYFVSDDPALFDSLAPVFLRETPAEKARMVEIAAY